MHINFLVHIYISSNHPDGLIASAQLQACDCILSAHPMGRVAAHMHVYILSAEGPLSKQDHEHKREEENPGVFLGGRGV